MAKDGHLHLGPGLLTHHADSRLQARLAADGPFFVKIEDAQHQGGEAFGYRLRVSAPRPDFALRVVPSALNAMGGQVVPVTVFVERRDGFRGPVSLAVEGGGAEWKTAGAVVPAGRDRVRFTVEVPWNAAPGVWRLSLTGRAETPAGAITRMAEPADDAMQAFLWRHLVPAREWLARVAPGKGRTPPVRAALNGPLRIPQGGSAVVRFPVPRWILERGVEVSLLEAPEGLTMAGSSRSGEELEVTFRADAAKLPAGYADNLIMGASLKAQQAAATAPKKAQARGASQVMVLPAVPLFVTAQSS
jgi:hypothetical protein